MTVVGAVAVLLSGLGSAVSLATAAVLLSTVPAGRPGSTRTTSRKVATAPAGSVAITAAPMPVPPTSGLVTVNGGPDVCAAATKVVLGGMASVTSTFWASLGPLLVTLMV